MVVIFYKKENLNFSVYFVSKSDFLIFKFSDTLKGRFAEANAVQLREELGDLDKVVTVELETSMWTYLETRSTLLMKSYETSFEVMCSA